MAEEFENTQVTVEETQDSGRIIFADDVIATIASLATSEVEGVATIGGGVMEGFTERLGVKKNLTKGIKVEVGTEEVAVDISVSIKFGFRIREVCEKIQNSVKCQIETMTGLTVVEVNVFVQSVVFESTEPTRAEKRAERERAKELKKELEAQERAKEAAALDEIEAEAVSDNEPRA